MPFSNVRCAAFLVAVAMVGPTATFAASTSADSAPTAKLAECSIEGLARAARCGSVDVLENPNRPNGRHIALAVVVVPAKNGHAKADAIIEFGGGPGEAAASFAGDAADQFASLNEERDLLFYDQRGTGKSNGLFCNRYASDDPAASVRDAFSAQAAERCTREVATHADPTQYSYARVADDTEAVRRALGYASLDLIGISYGSRAAQTYVRAYPKSVRTAFIVSAVPVDVAMPLPFARAEEDAIDRTIDACSAEAACRTTFPNLRDELRQIAARLDAGSVRVSVPGAAEPVPLARGRFAEHVRAMLYKPESAADVPLTLHRAFEGDWTPVVEGIIAHAHAADAEFSNGLWLAITCNEDIPFIDAREIAAATKGTLLGDYRVRNQRAVCAKWPKYTLPKAFREPIKSDVPTLFVSGDADPATPTHLMRHLAQGFSHNVVIEVRGQGHGAWSDCVDERFAQLVRSGSVDGMSGQCPATPRPPFKTSP